MIPFVSFDLFFHLLYVATKVEYWVYILDFILFLQGHDSIGVNALVLYAGLLENQRSRVQNT